MSALRRSLPKCRRIADARAMQAADPAPESAGATASPTADLTADLTAAWARAAEADRDKARARLAAVRHSDELAAMGLSRTAADKAAAAAYDSGAGVSTVSLGAWRRKVRGLPESARVAALLDAPRAGRPSQIDAAMAETLAALAFHDAEHLTADFALSVLVARHDADVSVHAVRRWLARWRTRHARALSAVTNPDRHRSHRKPAGGDAAASIVRLNQLWELDSTPADVMCIGPKGSGDGKARRHAIVAVVDIWSRRAKVLVVPTSRATAIAALLRRSLLAWGVPEAVRTDEGRDYTSRHVLGVLADLEIEHRPCLPYTPEAKPFVERFLGTLARGLFAHLPGVTGHDVAQAQAIRGRRSFAARRGKGAAETFGVALTAEDLQAKCDAWCDDVYARRGHDGLGGMSPFDRARSWTGPIRRIPDERALDALLAEPVTGDPFRTVSKDGIKADGGVYIAPALGSLIGERVQVRRDPADLGRLAVYLPDPDGPHDALGRFVCVAEDPDRTGIDRAAVAAGMKAAAAAADKHARQWARDLQRTHRPETAMDDVLAHAAVQAGKVVALTDFASPKPGEVHTPPALVEAGRAAVAADKAARSASGPPAPDPTLARAKARVAAANRRFREEDW